MNPLELATKAAIERYVEADVPESADVWPIVGRRLAAGEKSRTAMATRLRRRTLFAAALVALCLGVISAVTAAAVPPVRQAWMDKLSTLTGSHPSRTSGISSRTTAGGGERIAVDSSSNVTVVSPDYLPEGLTIRELADIPRRPAASPGQRLVVPQGLVLTSELGSQQPRKVSDATSAAVSSLAKVGVDIFYARFSSPSSGGYVELIETASLAGQPQVTGESIAVDGVTAQLQESGDQTAIQMTRGPTVVTVRTNLGRAEALKVAENLKP